MSFGEQLKCRRKELGLSRSELAKLLAEARKEDDRRPPHARRALFRGIMRLLERR